MGYELTKRFFQLSCAPALLGALLLAAPYVNAQEKAQSGTTGSQVAGNTAPAAVSKEKTSSAVVVTPVFTNYKGVAIGMSADVVRMKLDHLREKGKGQDLFVFSDNETAQVYYNPEGKVMAVALSFVGEKSGALDARTVLGEDLQAKSDGSMYKLVRYPEAGYWVSYSRTAGDTPVTTVTIQKIP